MSSGSPNRRRGLRPQQGRFRPGERLDQLEVTVRRLELAVERLEAELRATGHDLRPIEPRKRTPLSQAALREHRRLSAARARAAKRPGPGVGGVNSAETAARMQAEYEELCANTQQRDRQR